VDIAQVARAWPSLARLGGRQQLQPRVQPQPERLRGTARSSALIGAAHCPTAERPASAARPRSSPLGRGQVVHPVAGLVPWLDLAWAECSGRHEDALVARLHGPVRVADGSARPNLCSRSLTGMITTFARPATRVHSMRTSAPISSGTGRTSIEVSCLRGSALPRLHPRRGRGPTVPRPGLPHQPPSPAAPVGSRPGRGTQASDGWGSLP
jgi:hypothetical protein